MLNRRNGWIAVAGLALIALAPGANAAITSFEVFKTLTYDQIAQVPNGQPFNFTGYGGYARIIYNNNADFTAARVTSLSPLSPMVLSGSNGLFVFFAPNVSTKQVLDTDFPNGTLYTFSLSGGTLGAQSASLSPPAADGYATSVPVFSNNTYNLLQGVDPSAAIPLSWNTWSAPTFINTPLTFVTINRTSDNLSVFSTSGNNTLTSTSIPANTLQPNTQYTAVLAFSARSVVVGAGFGGSPSGAAYDLITSLTFTTGAATTAAC